MNRTISLDEARVTLDRWVRAASGGERVLITQGGEPVAALISAEALAALDGWAAPLELEGVVGLLGCDDPGELLRYLEE